MFLGQLSPLAWLLLCLLIWDVWNETWILCIYQGASTSLLCKQKSKQPISVKKQKVHHLVSPRGIPDKRLCALAFKSLIKFTPTFISALLSSNFSFFPSLFFLIAFFISVPCSWHGNFFSASSYSETSLSCLTCQTPRLASKLSLGTHSTSLCKTLLFPVAFGYRLLRRKNTACSQRANSECCARKMQTAK